MVQTNLGFYPLPFIDNDSAPFSINLDRRKQTGDAIHIKYAYIVFHVTALKQKENTCFFN